MSSLNNTVMAILLLASAVVLIGGLALVPTMQSASAVRQGIGGGCGGTTVDGEFHGGCGGNIEGQVGGTRGFGEGGSGGSRCGGGAGHGDEHFGSGFGGRNTPEC